MSLTAEVVSHWKRMREDARGVYEKDKERPCGEQCAFCTNSPCARCPISAATGQSGCIGTPYDDAKSAWCDYFDSKWDEAYKLYWQLKADAMIGFLEGLPDDE